MAGADGGMGPGAALAAGVFMVVQPTVETDINARSHSRPINDPQRTPQPHGSTTAQVNRMCVASGRDTTPGSGALRRIELQRYL